MVIDDLANRRHDCDLLLDQNYYFDMKRRYQELVPERCVVLYGLTHVLLRPEFAIAKNRFRNRDGVIKRILIFFGGSDPTNQTQKAVEAIVLLRRPDIAVDVVVGSTNPNRKYINTLCDSLPNMTFHCQISNMAELILGADLCIGAGGASMWERCYLGLPTITVVFASNQERTTEDVAQKGAIEYLGWSHTIDSRSYAQAITSMINDQQKVRRIINAALKLFTPNATLLTNTMQQIISESKD